MNLRLAAKALSLFVCIFIGACSRAATESNPDDLVDASTGASASVLGEKAGQVRADNGLKMKLVRCLPGTFTMGSPPSDQNRGPNEDEVSAALTSGFWLGKYEVTQGQWKQLMGTTPWMENGKARKNVEEGPDYPVTYLSWKDAVDFCHKLTEQERIAGHLPEGWEYALPTEAQWERACRALTETRFCFGNSELKLGDYGWSSENSSNARQACAHRVGQKKANSWGLFDMHGNVSEWCRDVYADDLPGGLDPEVKPEENKEKSNRLRSMFRSDPDWIKPVEAGESARVFRGGNWYTFAWVCRSTQRNRHEPSHRDSRLGFRVALSQSGNSSDDAAPNRAEPEEPEEPAGDTTDM